MRVIINGRPEFFLNPDNEIHIHTGDEITFTNNQGTRYYLRHIGGSGTYCINEDTFQLIPHPHRSSMTEHISGYSGDGPPPEYVMNTTIPVISDSHRCIPNNFSINYNPSVYDETSSVEPEWKTKFDAMNAELEYLKEILQDAGLIGVK